MGWLKAGACSRGPRTAAENWPKPGERRAGETLGGVWGGVVKNIGAHRAAAMGMMPVEYLSPPRALPPQHPSEMGPAVYSRPEAQRG